VANYVALFETWRKVRSAKATDRRKWILEVGLAPNRSVDKRRDAKLFGGYSAGGPVHKRSVSIEVIVWHWRSFFSVADRTRDGIGEKGFIIRARICAPSGSPVSIRLPKERIWWPTNKKTPRRGERGALGRNPWRGSPVGGEPPAIGLHEPGFLPLLVD